MLAGVIKHHVLLEQGDGGRADCGAFAAAPINSVEGRSQEDTWGTTVRECPLQLW